MGKKTRSRKNKEMKKFWLASSLAVFSLLAGAIFQLNSYIHASSLAADSKKKIAAISSENGILETRLSQSNSLENFNQYQIAQENNYEKVDIAGVRYIRAAAGELAKK